MLRTEGRGLESHLCQGLRLAGSRWSDIIGSSLGGRKGGRKEGLSNLESRIRCTSYEPGVTVTQARGMRLGEGVSLSGSLDPHWDQLGSSDEGISRDELYAVDLNSMGGVIEEIGV